MAAPLASAPDGPTHTAIGTRERLMARTTVSMFVSIAPDESSCRISSVARLSFASWMASRTSETLGASR